MRMPAQLRRGLEPRISRHTHTASDSWDWDSHCICEFDGVGGGGEVFRYYLAVIYMVRVLEWDE